ncbi:phosphoribosylanthranilate isomerase [Sphingomonas mucosissima]|uniref:N-(5'-phosphoribosyl)anthranilate isomerase n=1 Tax=Sphingomonas mucosissima TaxID=370959 RepID=A0A245ZS51_9SPHN|nr:phosphoribosylanthranilate isomerase [Sphingomonas mucosissima]OWK32577.1 N-(5'-phosphoribosyl)anthranilate isomerase [Sphingomonas mucosissima]
MTDVKVCGIITVEALAAAVNGGATHVGFVFFAPSPRNLSFDGAAALAAAAPDHVRRVGVFVDPDEELLERAIQAGRLHAVQLHRTAPQRTGHLRQRTGLETWTAVAVKGRADLTGARDYIGAADRILFDAKTPASAALPGGMGVRFDWSLLDGFQHLLPWALSGGLDPANVKEAIRRTGAPLVDASSGLENAPGVKSVDKITAFLQAVAAS